MIPEAITEDNSMQLEDDKMFLLEGGGLLLTICANIARK